jgi:ferredoxin-NADP reductase
MEDILLFDELSSLQKAHPDRLKVLHTLTQKESAGYANRRVDAQMLREGLQPATAYDAKNYVLVCGPSGFS